MAEFVTVIKEAERMCHHYESCNYGCPFGLMPTKDCIAWISGSFFLKSLRDG